MYNEYSYIYIYTLYNYGMYIYIYIYIYTHYIIMECFFSYKSFFINYILSLSFIGL